MPTSSPAASKTKYATATRICTTSSCTRSPDRARPAPRRRASARARDEPRGRMARVRTLVGADDFEGLVDEDVVGPVDADGVDFVLAVAEFDDAIDDAAWIGGQCCCRGLVGGRSADDGPRAL